MAAGYVYAVAFTEAGFVMVYNRPRRGWEFPGGSIETGESPEEAARREFREETGRELFIAGVEEYPDGGLVFVGRAGEPESGISDPAISGQAVMSALPEDLAFPREEYEAILRRAGEVLDPDPGAGLSPL